MVAETKNKALEMNDQYVEKDGKAFLVLSIQLRVIFLQLKKTHEAEMYSLVCLCLFFIISVVVFFFFTNALMNINAHRSDEPASLAKNSVSRCLQVALCSSGSGLQ